MEQAQVITAILSELRVHAHHQGRLEAWDLIVTPWVRQHSQQIQLQELSVDAKLHLAVVEISPDVSGAATDCKSQSWSPRPRVSRDSEQASKHVNISLLSVPAATSCHESLTTTAATSTVTNRTLGAGLNAAAVTSCVFHVGADSSAATNRTLLADAGANDRETGPSDDGAAECVRNLTWECQQLKKELADLKADLRGGSRGADAWSPRPRVLRDSASHLRAAAGGIESDKSAEDILQSPVEGPLQSEPEVRVEDIIKGTLDEEPWQFRPYDNSSATWLAAAQRRHQHRRRTNALLGTAAVDLSGPHEPTPMVGQKVGQRPGHYFVALTIRRDTGLGFVCRCRYTNGARGGITKSTGQAG